VIYFLNGCSTQYYEPRVGKLPCTSWKANGFEVIVHAQNCCDCRCFLMVISRAARKYHRSNVPAWSPTRQGIPIVGTFHQLHPDHQRGSADLLDMHDCTLRLVAENTLRFQRVPANVVSMRAHTQIWEFSLHPTRAALTMFPCQYRVIAWASRPRVLGLIPD